MSLSPDQTPLIPPLATPPAAPGNGPADLWVPPALWLSDLAAAAQTQPSWLWHGYLAPGNVTLLTGQWKHGKTTLLAVLLAKLKAGGQLAGLRLAAARAVVVSEEGP